MDNTNELMKQSGLASLQRPRFSPGLLLEDEDLNAGVSYTRDLTRLLFKSLFGCGVICGLRVTARPTCNGRKREITVEKGLALDCLGNPLEVPQAQVFEYDPKCDEFPDAIWVVICYVERCCRPKDAACSPDDEVGAQNTRVRAGFDIKLYSALPKCACHCRTSDDDTPPVNHHDGCCDEEDSGNANRSTVAARSSNGQNGYDDDSCACYSAHYRGDCECDCGCTCVVIGKIMPKDIPSKDGKGMPIPEADQKATVNTDMVRRIRPVLNGYLACRFPESKPEDDSTAGKDPGEELEAYIRNQVRAEKKKAEKEKAEKEKKMMEKL